MTDPTRPTDPGADWQRFAQDARDDVRPAEAAGDDQWRRPDPATADTTRPGQPYPGPPSPPPTDPATRPELRQLASPPRRLPKVDDDAIDESERRARWFTLYIGGFAALILMITAIVAMAG